VDGVENKSTTGREDLDVPADMILHFTSCAVIQNSTCVDTTAPEGNIRTEFPLQPLGLHITRVGLNRVEDLETGFDQVGDQLVNGTAGVQESMHGAVIMDIAAKDPVARFEQALVHLRAHDRTGIHAEVVPEADDIDQVTDCQADLLEGCQMAKHQGIQEALNFSRITNEIHDEVIQTTDKGAPLEQVAAG